MATLKELVDEVINIENDIVECRANLSNILKSKNIEVDEQDTISDLIEKSDVLCNYASGSVNISETDVVMPTNIKIPIDISFTPKVVKVRFKHIKLSPGNSYYWEGLEIYMSSETVFTINDNLNNTYGLQVAKCTVSYDGDNINVNLWRSGSFFHKAIYVIDKWEAIG